MSTNFNWIRKIVSESRNLQGSVYSSDQPNSEKLFDYNRSIRPSAEGFNIEGTYSDLKGQTACLIELGYTNKGGVFYQESHPERKIKNTVYLENGLATFKNSSGEKELPFEGDIWVSANLPYAIMFRLAENPTDKELVFNIADVENQSIKKLHIHISPASGNQVSARFLESEGYSDELFFSSPDYKLIQWKGNMRPKLFSNDSWNFFNGVMKFNYTN